MLFLLILLVYSSAYQVNKNTLFQYFNINYATPFGFKTKNSDAINVLARFMLTYMQLDG